MNKAFIFALGAAAGSFVTWKIVKEKYKRIADEEIASVVETFNKRFNKLDDTDSSTEKVEVTIIDKKEMKEYEDKVDELKYGERVVEEEVFETIPAKDYIKPYVISPEEYGETGNSTISLVYYSDFVLADDDDEIVTDPEAVIGDALEHFGEYEDDAVHVRDDNIECDYEILKSEKTFSEVYKGDN